MADPYREVQITEFESVVLLTEHREAGLQVGDIGTVVPVHAESQGFEVEFIDPDAETRAVATLWPTDIGPLQGPDVPSQRGTSST